MELFLEWSRNFIYFMNGIIKTVIPLSFTIFIFAYREQKEVAYSLFKRKKTIPIIGFIVTTVILVVFNVIWIFDGSTVSQLSLIKIICLDVLALVWISFAIISYQVTLRNINVLKEYIYNIDKIKESFKKIEIEFKAERFGNDHKKFSKKIKRHLEEISVASEICFQILIAKDKYKLSNDFSKSFQKIDKVLIQNIISINQSPEKFSKIVSCSELNYYKLYISVLKYMSDLLEISFKGGKDTEINILINNLIEIQPLLFVTYPKYKKKWEEFIEGEEYSDLEDLESHFKDFYDQYYCVLSQVILTLYKNNDNRTARVFHVLVLKESQRRNHNKNDFLSLITSLFIKALHQNNIKLLTDVTNAFLDLVKNSRPPKQNHIEEFIRKSRIRLKRIEGIVKKNPEEKVSRIIFLGIVKSIELGHYQCAGFLIKNFVKNFEPGDIKLITENLYDNIENIHPDLELSKKLTNLLSTKITFSATSYEYCFLKAVLLVTVQQHYVFSIKNVYDVEHPNVYIDLNYYFKDQKPGYLSYLKSKVEGLNSLYGLLALESNNIKKFFEEKEIYKQN
ncbi:hypothetical protein [Bacillus cereus]